MIRTIDENMLISFMLLPTATETILYPRTKENGVLIFGSNFALSSFRANGPMGQSHKRAKNILIILLAPLNAFELLFNRGKSCLKNNLKEGEKCRKR